jgi:hypothetical protein
VDAVVTRDDLARLVDWHAPVVNLPDDGIYIGAATVDGKRVKRAAYVCYELAREALALLGVTDPAARRRVLEAVSRTTWVRMTTTAHGRERRWFTTEEMTEAILAAATSGCRHPDHAGMESCLHRHAHG